MKAGVVYPQIELGGDTGAVKAFAQAAEDLGYDHIVIYDHVLGAVHAGREPKLTGPYKESDPFHEPLVTYAYLAGVTKKLELVTGVIILPQRQTALFAKQAADVDLFSEGRLRLGVGVGWNWVEYDGLEMSRHFRRRGKRQEQQIALIRKLWEQPVVEYEDSDHRIHRAGILPRPKRPIPIWLGGFSEAAYDRAARIGDGFLFSGRTQTEAVQIKARIVAKLRELGRDADGFGFESIQQYNRGDNQWPGDIAAWREAGGSHISVVTMGANLNTVDGHIEAIKRWRDVYNSARERSAPPYSSQWGDVSVLKSLMRSRDTGGRGCNPIGLHRPFATNYAIPAQDGTHSAAGVGRSDGTRSQKATKLRCLWKHGSRPAPGCREKVIAESDHVR